MASLRIPTPLRSYTNGQSEVVVQGETIGAVLQDLLAQYPGLKTHLINNEGELRSFVNLYLNDNNVRDLHGLQTAVQSSDRLMLIPSIAGGVG